MVFSKSVQALGAIALLGAFIGPREARSQVSSSENRSAKTRQATKHDMELQFAEQRVALILHDQNGCSAWFREAAPDPAEVFESLQIRIGRRSAEFVLRTTNEKGDHTYKHPWGARSNQLAGRNSVVEINPEGPFFVLSLPVMDLGTNGGQFAYEGHRVLTVGGFAGGTLEAQLSMLLHELAHVVGRIPEDDDSWDKRSSRNTEEILLHCRSEIRNYSQKQ